MPWQKGVSEQGKGKGKGSGKGKSKGEMQHPAKVQKKLEGAKTRLSKEGGASREKQQ